MYIRKIKNYFLKTEQTLPYFIEHIKCNKVLSERVCEKIDFNQGSFFTILPEGISLEKLFCFEWGIISMAAGDEEDYQIENLSDPSQVLGWRTMDQECSRFVASFLCKSTQNWAVVDDYNLDPQSPHVNRKNVKMCPYGYDVHYFLNQENTVDEICRTITKSDRMWHSLVVLTQLEGEISSILTDSVIDEICANVKFVITGAYDGEGYVFWQAEK